ncbi:Succinyl-CoA ligase [ADP-forming] subunit beta [Novipirellula galeiformis]|uniref:Succinate--CoA ligase [ADP-forming] subunit beta n=2 Tax=Novipirellula galeiformis TaxID=2528004 RepID=A0A5C6CHL8_9BACT|nr:Succinyl-CoA ligase [ADP-forming] subunit beta [Novipirellula galeiformis]
MVPESAFQTYIFYFSETFPLCASAKAPFKSMKIHEYQGKQLFRKAGVPVLEGHVATTADEAAAAYDKLGGSIAVVKAQIHAGGRGKGTIIDNPEQRGVVLVKSADEARAAANGLLGKTLVTIQTGEEGKVVNQVFVEAGCDIARELYLGIVVDREAARPVLMVSTEGGVEIEKVAEETPELIFKEHFDPAVGLEAFQVRKLCKKLGIEGAAAKAAFKFMPAICRFFVDYDCAMAEINPLVITGSGEMIALDAKITFDDNALYRHKDLLEFRDLSEEEPSEVRASDAGLSYVKLEGNIGCLVNGAGLAMSTMDIIKYHGGKPANFLDVGGGANAQQVTEAFRILLSDPNCKGVLVNIFGGIARCTTIASALIEASKTVGFTVPLVVRLEGTEVEEGRKMLAESDVNVINATDITDAAKKIVAAAAG